MSNSKEVVDGLLVDWGGSLFNIGPVVVKSSGGSLNGFLSSPKPAKKGGGSGGGSGPAASANQIRNRLRAIAKRSPEVMVKITRGAPKGMRQIKRHFDYISRKGEIPIEDQEGNVIRGKDGLEALRDDWAYDGQLIGEDEGRLREAFHIVLSMPAGTDELGVKRAARDFAAKEFAGHLYVMAAHTFDADPDPEPSKHPHVHVAVKARGQDGRRLNPRKADLQRWREGFAEALRDNGIEAAASKRLQRLQNKRPEKQFARHMSDDGRPPANLGNTRAAAERVERSQRIEAAVRRQHKELYMALAQSIDGTDKELAGQLARHWTDPAKARPEVQRSPDRAELRPGPTRPPAFDKAKKPLDRS